MTRAVVLLAAVGLLVALLVAGGVPERCPAEDDCRPRLGQFWTGWSMRPAGERGPG